MAEYSCDDCKKRIESDDMCIDGDGAFLCDECYERRLQESGD